MPPDGTGKKSKQTVTVTIYYTNGSNSFSVGDKVLTDDGFDGDVLIVAGDQFSGHLHIVVSMESILNSVESGTSLKVGGVTFATSTGTTNELYTQDIVITGGNDPTNKASVDVRGALTTTFESGDPSFDAFGKLQTSETTTIREYQPVHNSMSDEFTETEELGATVSWDETRHLVVMENPTTNGARSMRRTNLYHKYQTGVATTVMFSAFSGGDYINVVRRMGIFDDSDGLYYKMTDGVISVCVRSSCNGSIEEVCVPQSEWNIDRLDGSDDANNVSGKSLVPGMSQIMIIDFQWLGAGRVRFSFVIDGIPIVCHEFNHAGYLANPYMRTGTLPFTMEQENVGALGNPAFLYGIAAKVACEGKFAPPEKLYGGSIDEPVTVDDDVDWVHIASFRSRKQYGSPLTDNRSVVIPTMVTLSELTSTGNPWLLELVKNDTLDTPMWDNGVSYPQSALEVASASGSIDGKVVMSWIVTGDEHISLSDFFSMLTEIIIRKSDIELEPDHYTLRAKLYNTVPIEVVVAFNWKEIR